MQSEATTNAAPASPTKSVTLPVPRGRNASAPSLTSRAVAGDLALVFVVALAVRLVWAVLLPPWQAIDETEHFAYVNHIAEQGQIPTPNAPAPYPRYSEELQRSMDNTSFFPLVRGEPNRPVLIPLLDPAEYATARQFSASGPGRFDAGYSRATSYPPLYYLILAVPDRLLHTAPVVSRMFALRAVSSLFGALASIFAYLIGYDLFRSRRWGWCVGLCAAFMPASAHVFASINNDALMDLLATVLVWAAVRIVLRGCVTPGLTAIALVSTALVLLTKPSALPVIVVVALFALGVLWLQLRERTRASRFQALPWIVLAALVVCIGVGWLASYRFATTSQLPLIRSVVNGITPPADTKYSLADYLQFLLSAEGRHQLWIFYWTFWGWFGWGYAALPTVVSLLTVPVFLVGLVGAVRRAIHRPNERPVWWLFLALIVGQLFFLFIGVEYRLAFATTGTQYGLTGRYVYPVLVPILLALIAGWAWLFHDSSRVLRGAALAMFALNLVGWSAVLSRYYDVMVGWIR